MDAKSLGRIPALDGMRGYAALWVLLGHSSTRTGFFVPVLASPDIAVGVFMIVSGFLMTQHSFARQAAEPWNSPRTWIIFYVRRFFRIAPLYYFLLIPSFLAFDVLHGQQRKALKLLLDIDYSTSVNADLTNVLMHVSFLFGLSSRYFDALTIPDWSLALEMQFYAVFPFLLLFARRFNIVRFWLCGLTVWLVFRKLSGYAGHGARSILSIPSFLPLNFGFFLIGMLLAWAWTQEKGKLTPRAAVLLLLSAGVAVCSRDQTIAMTGAIYFALTGLLGLMLFQEERLIGLLPLDCWIDVIKRVLGNRFAHFLADVSYGVYLLHLLIIVPLLAKLCEFPWFVHQRSPFRFLMLTAIAGPLTYGLAWILFRSIEEPGIHAGKHIIERFLKVKRPAVAVR